MNGGKTVAQSFNPAVLGGEMDVVKVDLLHNRGKGAKFRNKTAALLCIQQVSQGCMQHWGETFCFIVGFRRLLLSLCQDVFHFIRSFLERNWDLTIAPLRVRDEVLLAAVLCPLA